MNLKYTFINICPEEQLKKFTKINNQGKVAINSIELFSYFDKHIEKTYNLLDVLQAFAFIATASSKINFKKSPHTGSLNNCMGRWFELIFLKEFNELIEGYNNDKIRKYDIIKLPSATDSKKFYKLFIKNQRQELNKIKPSTSNPDFILLRDLDKVIVPTELSLIDRYKYLQYFGNIDMRSVDTVISIKTSARPDRRYQQVYEANLVKALFQKFNLSIKFITITLHENKKNEEVYFSPSIISIIRDKDNFQPSIDEHIILNKIEDVKKLFNKIILKKAETGKNQKGKQKQIRDWNRFKPL